MTVGVMILRKTSLALKLRFELVKRKRVLVRPVDAREFRHGEEIFAASGSRKYAQETLLPICVFFYAYRFRERRFDAKPHVRGTLLRMGEFHQRCIFTRRKRHIADDSISWCLAVLRQVIHGNNWMRLWGEPNNMHPLLGMHWRRVYFGEIKRAHWASTL